jgi:hypothetical protein
MVKTTTFLNRKSRPRPDGRCVSRASAPARHRRRRAPRGPWP